MDALTDALKPFAQIVFIVSGLLCIAWIFLKPYRSKISLALVTLLTAGLCAGYLVMGKAREKTTPLTVQADQTELVLRLSSALGQMSHDITSKLPVGGHGSGRKNAPVSDKVLRDMMKESEDALDIGFKDDPTNVALAVKRVILLHHIGEPIEVPLNNLNARTLRTDQCSLELWLPCTVRNRPWKSPRSPKLRVT